MRMRGRLKERVSAWKKLGVGEEVLKWVEEGVKVMTRGIPKEGGRENKVKEEQTGFVVETEEVDHDESHEPSLNTTRRLSTSDE